MSVAVISDTALVINIPLRRGNRDHPDDSSAQRRRARRPLQAFVDDQWKRRPVTDQLFAVPVANADRARAQNDWTASGSRAVRSVNIAIWSAGPGPAYR